MRLQLLILIALFGFGACSPSKKETASDAAQENNTETSKPEGIIINPQTEADTLKGSPKAYIQAKIGNTNFEINYYSPATRGRMIWGGLVAFGNVWVTGAHKATSIEFDRDIKIGNSTVVAGKYAFFTIPGEREWTVIINKNWNQHLADDYNQAEDLVRISVIPSTEGKHQERLRYVIESKDDASGEIVMNWDKLEVSVPFKILL